MHTFCVWFSVYECNRAKERSHEVKLEKAACRSLPQGKNDGVAGVYMIRADVVKLPHFVLLKGTMSGSFCNKYPE